MPDEAIIQQAVDQTIQPLPDKQDGFRSGYTYYGVISHNGFLPEWGTRRRERWLRAYDRHELNTLWQGAMTGIIKKVQSSPWEIKGPKSGVQYFQDMLRDAAFGMGWDDFVGMFMRDYLRQDVGGFVEVIGPGDPSGPITGRITGLAPLDAMRCFPTGVPEYPVIYWPIAQGGQDGGQMHWLHRTRVLRFVDMPDPDENYYGPIGLCALSRAIAVVQREVLMEQYIAGRLDDKSKPAILLGRNLSTDMMNAVVSRYNEQRNADAPGVFGDTVVINGTAVEHPVEIEQIQFSEPPEKFDFRQYKVDIDVNELALALGVDVQELWQLSGGTLGSGTQSAILHSKSRGKTFGMALKMIERAINNVLPSTYTFEFKFEDNQDDLERANVAQAWSGFVTQSASYLTPEEGRRLLANKVAAVMDVITDENGEIIRLDDADPVEDAVVPDVGTTPEAEDTDTEEALGDDAQKAFKEFEDTRSEFVDAVMDTINAAQGGDMPRRRFGVVMRANLRRLGTQAFQDGLEDGGVPAEDMDDRDRAAVQEWLRIQSPFVTNFANRVFGNELSEAQVEAHAEMWGNKSLRDAFQLGQASAGWNAMYTWVIGPTEESCPDCLRYNGQRHRMRDWRKKKSNPRCGHTRMQGIQLSLRFRASTGRTRIWEILE